MLKHLAGWFGYEVRFVCEWGTFIHRYDSIDLAMQRPIHPQMSVAPPWAKRRFIKK